MPFDATPMREIQECPAPTATPRFPDEIAIIDKMTALIATPETWCQGYRVYVTRSGRRQYCLVGAFNMADCGNTRGMPNDSDYSPAARSVWTRLCHLSGIGPINFNDHHQHGQVLRLLAEARRSFL